MAVRALSSMLLCLCLCLGLAGCGGGSLEIFWADSSNYFIVFGSANRFTASATVELDGKAFLPHGATCSFSASPSTPTGCSCDAGQAVGQWTNSATGGTGRLELAVVANPFCAPVEIVWRTPVIALAPGNNFISLSFFDATLQGGANVIVVRN